MASPASPKHLDQDTKEEESDGSEETSEEGSEEEEEEEPKLKYQRLGADVLKVLKQDHASCMYVHEKFLVLGTQNGYAYLLDFNGDEIKHFSSHQAKINEISVDEVGEYLCTCSDDGKVVIHGLYNNQYLEVPYKRPILSVALDPNYAKTKQFFCGGKEGSLIRNSKGFFKTSNSVIHSGEGPIQSIAWKGTLIAWANDVGVKIYDVQTNQRITFIERPKNSPRPDIYRCHLCWESEHILLIGWADSIKIGAVKERNEHHPSGLPSRYVEIIAMFQTEFLISGIAPFGDYLVVLAFIADRNSKSDGGANAGEATPPELRIITRNNEEISYDALEVKGYNHYTANMYRLDHMSAESLFYIVAPKDIVLAKPRDLDDHIAWLIDPERAKFDIALEAAEKNEGQLKRHKLIEIGEKYLTHLMDNEQFSQAASQLPRILKKDPELWETWILKFGRVKRLAEIAPHIPVGNPKLSPMVYEVVLNYFLQQDPNDHSGFLQVITEWSPTLYNLRNIITVVLARSRETSDPKLMDALALLYSSDQQFDKTLHIYLRLKKPEAFDLIKKYNLFHTVKDKVALLMDCNQEKAIDLFISNTDKVPIQSVIEQLEKDNLPKLYAYLHCLFVRDPHAAPEYHVKLIELLADYDYPQLLKFLRTSAYPLETAYKIVEQRGLYPEMVYILGRMGNTKEALTLLVDKIGDVKQAVDFVSEQHDKELWEDLIDHSMKNPEFVSGLLENIGACEFVKPLDLIKRIPDGMRITKLRDRLVKIISDYNLQMSLRVGCNTILKRDCVDLIERQNTGQRRALRIDNQLKCTLCAGSVVATNMATEPQTIVAFFCKHVYHSRCLQSATHNAPQQQMNSPGSETATLNAAPVDEFKFDRNEPVEKHNERDKLTCVICRQKSKPKKRLAATSAGLKETY